MVRIEPMSLSRRGRVPMNITDIDNATGTWILGQMTAHNGPRFLGRFATEEEAIAEKERLGDGDDLEICEVSGLRAPRQR